jgi:hypothetical protein
MNTTSSCTNGKGQCKLRELTAENIAVPVWTVYHLSILVDKFLSS